MRYTHQNMRYTHGMKMTCDDAKPSRKKQIWKKQWNERQLQPDAKTGSDLETLHVISETVSSQPIT